MATYIEYQLDEETTILVETDDVEDDGMTKVGIEDTVGNTIRKVNQGFEAAFSQVKKTVEVIRGQLSEAKADEVQVSFGLKSTGEAGNFAIGKVGLEANYTVTLKWVKPPVAPSPPPPPATHT